ncbi:MAG: class flavin-dependent oxidoreductase [Deltaproteobacteria bacterium]|nr:class flavin-dependent oxidoreductase [Deltaproteobacteria bacterium]
MIFDVEINSAAHYPAADVPELIELAEQVGFGAFWKGESNSTDPFVMLSAVASRTKKIKLGTAIYHIYGRSPVTLGIQSATLQDLSGGRLLLGLGVANKAIAGWHGGVFDRPLKRAREYIDIVRKVAAGERVEYQGEIYNTGKRFQLSWKPNHPDLPVYLAGLGPQMTKLVGIAARVREGAIEAGRDPSKIEIIAKSRVSLNPDKNAARAKLRQVLTFYNIADHYSDMLRGMGFDKEVSAIHEAFQKGGFKAAMGALTDEYMDKLPVVPASDVREIKEKMKAFEEAGVTRMVIPYVPVTEPVVDDARRFFEAWGRA